MFALNAGESGALEAILTIDVDPVLPLSAATVEISAGVFPDFTKESQNKILEIIVPLGEWDLFARRFTHEILVGLGGEAPLTIQSHNPPHNRSIRPTSCRAPDRS